ncbi:MAG: menaquinone biosynthesis decarboxylase [Bacteroidales bacterium]|nr:menaquinone biosynthesis decarboxylase [Bacteroidales bacterium]
MPQNSLQQFIETLDSQGELLRISEYVNPELEITEVADRIMKQNVGGKALLFENTGTEFPLLINHYGSDIRILSALGLKSYDEPAERIDRLFSKFLGSNQGFKAKLALLPELKTASSWMPRKLNRKGKCQEVKMPEPDLTKLPILKCWPYDGGKFITLPMVITHDPETGLRNVGMYRMQIFDEKTTGMHWHLHKGGAEHYKKYKKEEKLMPVSVVIGGDPVLTYCATAPLPENIDEFLLAGFLKNQKVNLVKSLTNDIYVPDVADFIIEGYIDTNEESSREGPFGDHTGFYSLDDDYPVFHVTCITHRKDAVYPATIVGVPPMEDFYMGKATERIFLKPIQIAIAPEIIDIRLPSYGVAHNLVLIKAKTEYAGQSFKIMNALLGAGQMMFSKVLICFSEDVDIHDDKAVFDEICRRIDPTNKVLIGKGPSDVLDHSAYQYTLGGKLLIDATVKSMNNENYKLENASISNLKYQENNLVIIGADDKKESFLNQAKAFLDNTVLKEIKMLVMIDNFVHFKNPYLYAWYVLNNIDPSKDCLILKNCLIFDAGIKTSDKDGFTRRWPNIVSMDEKTIQSIDKKWSKIFNFELIESPSKCISKNIRGSSEIFEIDK